MTIRPILPFITSCKSHSYMCQKPCPLEETSRFCIAQIASSCAASPPLPSRGCFLRGIFLRICSRSLGRSEIDRSREYNRAGEALHPCPLTFSTTPFMPFWARTMSMKLLLGLCFFSGTSSFCVSARWIRLLLVTFLISSRSG